MYLFHPLFAILLTLLAVLCVRLTFIWSKADPAPVRYGTIDGLRGYLAFYVFLHHATVWVTFIRTDVWTAPDSNLYTHFGEASVAIFFMITSFLFYDKLLNFKTIPFNWQSFFIGRFFRLTPLYIMVMMVMFVIVAVLSAGTAYDTSRYLLFCALRWLSFTILGAPDINHIDAPRIVAGVTWSLPYEWCFYLVLPLIALSTGQRPKWIMLAAVMAGLATAFLAGLHWNLMGIFAGGMLAARLVRHARFTAFARRPLASAMVIACLAMVMLYPTAYALVPFGLLTIAFCLVVGGADLFGALLTPTSRRFGELAYSIYLIHGILLFSIIVFAVGKGTVAVMSAAVYWTLIALMVPVLLAFSAVTFHTIEKPGIEWGRRISARWFGTPAVALEAQEQPTAASLVAR